MKNAYGYTIVTKTHHKNIFKLRVQSDDTPLFMQNSAYGTAHLKTSYAQPAGGPLFFAHPPWHCKSSPVRHHSWSCAIAHCVAVCCKGPIINVLNLTNVHDHTRCCRLFRVYSNARTSQLTHMIMGSCRLVSKGALRCRSLSVTVHDHGVLWTSKSVSQHQVAKIPRRPGAGWRHLIAGASQSTCMIIRGCKQFNEAEVCGERQEATTMYNSLVTVNDSVLKKQRLQQNKNFLNPSVTWPLLPANHLSPFFHSIRPLTQVSAWQSYYSSVCLPVMLLVCLPVISLVSYYSSVCLPVTFSPFFPHSILTQIFACQLLILLFHSNIKRRATWTVINHSPHYWSTAIY